LLSRATDAVVETPPERWSLDAFYDPDRQHEGKLVAPCGGYLQTPVDRFDAGFFGISPREAANLDPQQRLLLEVTWEALEEGGIPPSTLRGTLTGVFVGAFTLDYKVLQFHGEDFRHVNAHTAVGSMMTMLSNRLSYAFDLRGPSLSIDTACSSSLVAIHQACQALRSGEIDCAVAGGVSLILAPQYSIAESRGGFLSPDGRCKAFDVRANGYVRGEGAGVLILKPLSRALADGNRIHAIIRGSAANQDGNSNGITVPRQEAQQAVLRAACGQAGILPGQLDYVEAHGTGTPVGDPIEAAALGSVLADGRDPSGRVWVGSVKTNIGHLEAASGVAGAIKAILCLEHGAAPPNLHFQTPNPKIDFEHSCIRVPTHRVPLAAPGRPLLAGVNSFGFGGTNCHLVLEQAPREAAPAIAVSQGPQLIPLSARSEQALSDTFSTWSAALAERTGDADALTNVGHTAALRRDHHEWRSAVVADSWEELRSGLAAGPAVMARAVARAEHGGPVFVFSGMGPQWWGMGRQLLAEEPVFRSVLEACDRVMRKHADWSLLEELTRDEQSSRILETCFAQPANFAVQLGLVALWQHWGIRPSAIVGHSTGEVAASCVAGALSFEDAVRVIVTRSRLQHTLAGTGTMAALGASPAEAAEYIARCSGELAIAAVNGPTAVTLAGERQALEQISDLAAERGVFFRFLRVDIAYHSASMDRIRKELLSSLRALTPREAHLPLYSTVTGGLTRGDEWDAEYWWHNVRDSVLFADAIRALLDEGYTEFLEVGPHPVLSGSISDVMTAQGQSGNLVSSLKRGEDERRVLLQNLGALYALGFNPNWPALYPEGSLTELPRYAWQKEPLWSEPPSSLALRTRPQQHPLLGRTLPTHEDEWESEPSLARLPWLEDHNVGGQVVYPGAAYVEMALQAVRATYGAGSVAFHDLELQKALFLTPSELPRVRLQLRRSQHEFAVRTLGRDERPPTTHVAGRVRRIPSGAHGRQKAITALRPSRAPDLSGDAFYSSLQRLGFNYGPQFRTVSGLWLEGDRAIAEVAVSEDERAPNMPFELDPRLLDGCFQALLGIELRDQPLGEVRLPVRIDELCVHGQPGARVWAEAVRRSQDATDTVGDIYVYDAEGRLVLEILGFRVRALDAATGTVASAVVDRWLYGMTWQPAPSAETEVGVTASDATWVVLKDQSGFGNELASRLRAAGACVWEVDHAATFARVAEQRFAVRPDRREDFAQLAEALRGVRVAGFVHLWNLDAKDAECASLDEVRAAHDLGTLSALYLSQAVLEHGLDARLWLLTRGAVWTGPQDAVPNPLAAPVWGFARVLGHQESVSLWGGIGDLARGGHAKEPDQVARWLLSGDAEDEVAWRDGQVLLARLEPAPTQGEAAPPWFRPEGTLLITGAFGALGQLVAKWAVRHGARHLLCLGTRPLPARSEWRTLTDPGALARVAVVRELEALGATVHVGAVDLTQRDAVRGLLDAYAADQHPPIRGVIFAAGVVNDTVLHEMTEDTFTRVTAPKILGSWTLHEYFEEARLDCFVLFSSVASLVTSTGQTNYAAGNAFLDALAAYRRARGLPGLSVNWGPWAVGMVKELGLVEHYRRRGMEPLTAEGGLQALDRVWTRQEPQLAVVDPTWPTVLEYYAAAPRLFAHLATEASDGGQSEASEEQPLSERLSSAPPAARGAIIEDELAKLAGRVLRINPASIARDVSFTALGIDSMMAAELRNRIDVQLKTSVPIVDLLGGASVATLGAKLLDRLELDSPPTPGEADVELEQLLANADAETVASLLAQVRSASPGHDSERS
jgi:acyl transferase domain-containing protein